MPQERQRRKVTRHHRPQPGAPPGTLVSHHQTATSIRVIGYGKDTYSTFDAPAIEDIKALAADFEVVWVNVVGLADVDSISELGEIFGIHHLTLEDILNIHQRAKFESFESYDFIVTQMASFEDESKSNSVTTSQLCIILQDKFVFTFQDVATDCLGPVRRRIKEKTGLINGHGADYLVYALLDSVIDHYFPVLDRLSDCVADFDDDLINEKTDMSLKEVHALRRELLHLSRKIRPTREMLSRLMHESTRINESTRVFLGDCFDHALQLSESIDLNREICSDLRSYHLALVGQRTNDVMKTLTIVSTIFIPLSFITGLYGMNFVNMPELQWKFGYFGTWPRWQPLPLGCCFGFAALVGFENRKWGRGNAVKGFPCCKEYNY